MEIPKPVYQSMLMERTFHSSAMKKSEWHGRHEEEQSGKAQSLSTLKNLVRREHAIRFQLKSTRNVAWTAYFREIGRINSRYMVFPSVLCEKLKPTVNKPCVKYWKRHSIAQKVAASLAFLQNWYNSTNWSAFSSAYSTLDKQRAQAEIFPVSVFRLVSHNTVSRQMISLIKEPALTPTRMPP